MKKAKTYKAPSMEKFKAMTAPQKRVAIAKDVLAMLAAKTYKATRGKYVNRLQWKDRHQLDALDNNADMRDNFDKLKNCQVCAMGAVLMSAIRLQDNVTVGTVVDMDDIGDGVDIFLKEGGKQLKKLFPKNQLALMEVAFEHEDRSINLGRQMGARISDSQTSAAEQYGYRIKSAKAALTKIMENVIANKGTFVVPK